jgi:hypothetical protein
MKVSRKHTYKFGKETLYRLFTAINMATERGRGLRDKFNGHDRENCAEESLNCNERFASRATG